MADVQQINSGKNEYPFYIKSTIILAGLILFFFALHVLGDILVPVAFACLIAILLNPVTNKLERKLPRMIAISCSLLAAMIVVAAIFFFLSRQIASFAESIPALKVKSGVIVADVQQWISHSFGISTDKQVAIMKKELNDSSVYVSQTVSTLLGVTSVLLLIPIYVFFLLYYKPLILDFLFQIFSEKDSLRVAEILSETKIAIQSYVMGLLIEMVIVSAMNSIALLALGVRSAILLGVIGGILNMIPYLGGLVATALPVLMATVYNDGYSIQLGVIAAYLVIQFIDNNILMTRIVSSKVQINALISIIIVLMGGALWGVSGMFLSIPFVAILKIIFDRIEGLKPWGHMLGDKIPEEHAGVKFQAQWNRIFRRKLKKEIQLNETKDTTE